ncbi:MAG: DUF1499 domain-containing protein [Caulobacterales bacterium]|nr:DUF1499 domain-containing protein [Caulobacterales bacterium]
MMAVLKWIVVIAVVLVAAGTGALAFLAHQSRGGQAPGLAGDRLSPCPDSPNCVSSEAGEREGARIEPLAFPAGGGAAAWESLKSAITGLGGTITGEAGGYLSAEFRTPSMGFVDDVEARLDEGAGVIHLRSASRVGYSDRGVNGQRVAAIRAAFDG